MIIEPKVREYICTTAHPQGCAESVRNQADYACKQGMVNGTKKALIIGCSTGYGLASRICALENCGADTLGIMFERQANGRRTATPGWYNTAEFHRLASGKGVYAKTINGDAFSKEIKEKAIELIKQDLGKVDLVVYSLAAPRRTDAEGKTWSSCLKTTDEPFTEKSLDLRNNEITEKTVEPATEEEVLSTVKVMGGEDWADWIDALKAADVLPSSFLENTAQQPSQVFITASASLRTESASRPSLKIRTLPAPSHFLASALNISSSIRATWPFIQKFSS